MIVHRLRGGNYPEQDDGGATIDQRQRVGERLVGQGRTVVQYQDR